MTPFTHSFFSTRLASPAAYDPDAAVKAELSRLIHAALISQNFRQRLLDNPLRAIESGFSGECFQFSAEHKERIQLIRADTLESFSMQITQTLNPAPLKQRVSLHAH
jgi:hypothetical protein